VLRGEASLRQQHRPEHIARWIVRSPSGGRCSGVSVIGLSLDTLPLRTRYAVGLSAERLHVAQTVEAPSHICRSRSDWRGEEET
jgi:hypothetical protein